MEDLVDSSTDWSSSDDSDVDGLPQDDDTEMLLLVLGMKEIEDRANLLDRRRGSSMGRMTPWGTTSQMVFILTMQLL